MKKFIHKIALSVVVPATLNPLVITSCSHINYDKIVKELKDCAIKEFKEICKYPHPTFSLEPLKNYLKNRITELHYEWQTDTYGNLWFDIPGSKGCENWKKVIIQGHMDMVYAGPNPDESIEPDEEIIFDEKTQSNQLVMHSKGYKTSLGADDGIGIATMLAICQNDKLKHGPIRFIMTADEEDGSKGADALSPDVLDCDYLINIDGEIDCGLAIACYGTSAWKFPNSFAVQKTGMQSNVFELSIDNLHGGHSGEDVGYGYANAERIAFEILNKANINENIQLIEINHKDKEGNEIIYQPNALIRNANVIFATNIPKDRFENSYKNLLNDFNNKYFGEDWTAEDKFSISTKTEYSGKNFYSGEDSDKIIRLMGDKDGFYCGLINILDKEKHVPGASSNIGPTSFNANADNDPDRFYTQVLGRSYLEDDILTFSGQEPPEYGNVYLSFLEIWEEIMGTTGGPKKFSTKLAWESTISNPIRDLLVTGYRNVAHREPNLVTLYGVLEESEFIMKKPSIHMITIGPRIENCHTQQETLFIDSIDTEYKALIYALSHYNSIY